MVVVDVLNSLWSETHCWSLPLQNMLEWWETFSPRNRNNHVLEIHLLKGKYNLNLAIKWQSTENAHRLLDSATRYILRLVSNFLRINLHNTLVKSWNVKSVNIEQEHKQEKATHLSIAWDSKNCFPGVMQCRQVEVHRVIWPIVTAIGKGQGGQIPPLRGHLEMWNVQESIQIGLVHQPGEIWPHPQEQVVGVRIQPGKKVFWKTGSPQFFFITWQPFLWWKPTTRTWRTGASWS